MLMFALALFILLAGSLPWVAVFRLMNKSSWLMALYLICSANVTLTLYIANSFYLLNWGWFVLAIHICIGGLGWWIWKRAGQPSLWQPFDGWREKINLQWIRREPALALLTLGITLSYTFAFVQIILVPQNNMDSLSTHLSRIVFWYQHGSFFPWPTFAFNQVSYPVNAQLQTYWTLLFLNNDLLVGSVQWLAVLVSSVGVLGMARIFGYNPRQSAFAALLFLSFPLVALQSTTTQTDLVTVAFFIPAVYFLIVGMRDRRYSPLLLSAISVGLGIGVKKSYFILLPILGILVVLSLLQFGKRSLKQLVLWSLSLVVGVAFLGAYGYVVNLKYFGGLFGSPTYINDLIETPQVETEAPKVMPSLIPLTEHPTSSSVRGRDDSTSGRDVLLELVYNVPRLFYQALDTSGLPGPLDGYVHKAKMVVARSFFHWIGFDEIEGTAYTASGHRFSFTPKNVNEESYAWYGPLSVLLILPALIYGIWRGLRERFYLLAAPGIAFFIFLPLEILFRPGWDPFQGRYFAPLVALCAPLMAMWFKEKGYATYEWLIGGLAVIVVVVTFLYNPSKPTLGKYVDDRQAWGTDRIFVQTIQRKNERQMYYMVEEYVPADSTLGYYIPFFIMDYPLFGEHLNRRLVPIQNLSVITNAKKLRALGIDYLLIPKRGVEYPVPAEEYQILAKITGWKLYVYVPPR